MINIKKQNTPFILIIYFILIIASTRTTAFSPAHYMTFLLGMLFLCTYLYFSQKPDLKNILITSLFLLLILLYPQNQALYLGACFFMLMIFCIFILQMSLSKWSKGCYLVLGAAATVLSFFVHGAFIFFIAILYLTGVTFSSFFSKKLKPEVFPDEQLKFYVVIVDLLFLLAIIGCTYPGTTPVTLAIRQSMIFTIPISFFIYILIANRKYIKANLFSILQPDTFFFFCFQVSFCIYGLGTYLMILVLVSTGCLYHFYAQIQLLKNMAMLKSQFDPWFSDKWELALAEQDESFSWSGFDALLQTFLSNDCIIILRDTHVLYRKGSASAPKVIPSSGSLSLGIHKTAAYQNFSIAAYYRAFALSQYLNDKLDQWDTIRNLHFTGNDGSYSKDLQFRKNVTYYLHDNVLQNIIAAKNIVSTLQTEKTALQSLAVETLTDLNDSIRSQMHEIFPSTLTDLPFERNIYILLDELQKKFDLVPQVHIDYTITEKIEEEYCYFFYRTIQEFLTNTCKHAQAKNIWIHMSLDRRFLFEFSNDGAALPDSVGEVKIKHLGLSSIIQQTTAFKGTFKIMQEQNKVIFRIILPGRSNENITI